MPDRVIRDELLESDRWLSLPTDTHRLVFVGLVLRCDDYGNIEGGPRRIYRWSHGFTQIKSEADSIKLMSDLQDADLVRRYEVEDREYWHVPRFKNARRYWSRKCPKSPYEEQQNQETAKKPDGDLRKACANPSRGVGVGVGVGEKQNKGTVRAMRSPSPSAFVLPEWIPPEPWNAWVEARKKSRKAPTEYALRLAVRKLDNLRERGESPAQVLAQSAFNGWADLYPQKEEKR